MYKQYKLFTANQQLGKGLKLSDISLSEPFVQFQQKLIFKVHRVYPASFGCEK